MGYEQVVSGSISFDRPVAVSEQDYTRLLGFEMAVCHSEFESSARPLLVSVALPGGADCWARPCAWLGLFTTLERIARTHGRSMTARADWFGQDGPRDRGVLVVDAGGLIHMAPSSDGRADLAAHRARACDCAEFRSPGAAFPRVPTPYAGVRAEPYTAGPFTDYRVMCDEHSEVVYHQQHADAADAREHHILNEHAERLLPPMAHASF
ncbi:hypothetical protein AB0N09_35820 [Streptomyces erythrochromogenes]|uniref:hypothetical protein n=1 Tax=Streptomyces erythrochromogenes TaxID=285574 RepID=UPI00341BAAB8